MLNKLKLLVQGKLPDYTEYLQLGAELRSARERIFELEMDKHHAEKNERANNLPVAGFDDFSVEPVEPSERRAYVAQVDEFYTNILGDKIRVSVGEIRQLLALASVSPGFERVPREQYDFFLRGMEAGLWKINDWAMTLQGELRDKQ